MKALPNNFITPLFLMLMFFVIPSCDKLPGANSEMKGDDAKASAALVGVWRGDGAYDGEEDAGWAEHWKMVRNEDGTYAVDYLIVHDQQKLYELTKDTGTWKFENGEYIETNHNGDKILYDVFSIKKDWFEYNIAAREGTANIQESKTVENFQLQEPPAGYTEVSYDLPQSEVELPESLNLDSLNTEDLK